MRVSNQSQRLGKDLTHLQFVFERLRSTLNFDHKQWADVLHLRMRDYKNIASGKAPLPATALVHAAESLRLNIESLATGRIDYAAVAKHYQGDLSYIPERYLSAAFSRKRTAISILNHLKANFVWQIYDSLLRHLQIYPMVLREVDEPISVLLMTDIFRYLKTKNFNDSYFKSLGKHSVKTHRDSALGAALSVQASPRALYEHMIANLTGLYEKNSYYKLLRLKDTECLIESKQNIEVAEALRVKQVTIHEGCLYKNGVLASVPEYANLPHSKVSEVSCVHRGDSSCRFHVDFEHADSVAKPSRRSVLH